MDSKTNPNQRRAVSASLPKRPTVLQMLQTPRSVSPSPTTMEHIAHSNDNLRNQSHPRVTGAIMRSTSDSATASSSQARHNLPQLRPPAPVNPVERLPAWAHWYEPSLSAAQVEHVRSRMKPPEEYLSMDPFQRHKVMTHDLSAALRSMCQTFNQSVKFHGKHAGKLMQEFLRPRGEAMSGDKKAPGPTKEMMIGIVSSKDTANFTGIKNGDTDGLSTKRQLTFTLSHHPLRANDTLPDNIFLLKKTGGSDQSSSKRRKTSESSSRQNHLGHHVDMAGGPQDEAQTPWRDLSHPTTSLTTFGKPLEKPVSKISKMWNEQERRQKDLSGWSHSSTTRTAENKKPDLPKKIKTATVSESKSYGYEDAERGSEKEKLVVNIPANLDMATDVRAYSQWPGMHESRRLANHSLTTLSR